MAFPRTPSEGGFTLAEAIIVIVIMGILFTAVAIFIQSPVKGFFDSARRAQLADIADTALQRISRDVRLALPNSVRIASSGGKNYLEFLLTSGGGRYRADGPGNVFVAGSSISNFDVLGPMPTFVGGESIVVFNLFADATASSANAYVGDNRTLYSSNTPPRIDFAAKTFPFDSPAHRFQVVQYPVTYECDPNPAGRVLRRYWGYAIAPGQATPPLGGSQALLASNVTGCSFVYSSAGVSQCNSVLEATISLQLGGETVSLFKQVHVNNVP